jgi:hypothetical protein
MATSAILGVIAVKPRLVIDQARVKMQRCCFHIVAEAKSAAAWGAPNRQVIIKAALSGIATISSRKGSTALCIDLAERLERFEAHY